MLTNEDVDRLEKIKKTVEDLEAFGYEKAADDINWLVQTLSRMNLMCENAHRYAAMLRQTLKASL